MRQVQNFKRYARQMWARRREFAEPQFWLKVARISRTVAQSELWPQPLLRKELEHFVQRPWNLHIEPTNACNADCVFCGYQYMERKKLILDMDVYKKALGDYVAIGGGDLMLEVVVGDPLLDPEFIEKVRLARAQPSIATIRTITNAIGLDRVGVHEFVTSGITKVLISTAGFDRQSYIELYRTKKYEKMRDNVLELVRTNRELGDPVEITIGFRTNRALKDVMADPDFQPIKAYDPKIDFTFAFCDWQGLIDVRTLQKGFVRREAPPKREPCAYLYDGPVVFSNGDVSLCGCQDFNASSELVVGNIMKSSLLELWQSARVAEIRRDFMTKPPDLCQKCGFYRNLDTLRTVDGVRRAWLTHRRFKGSLCNGGMVDRDEASQLGVS
jgi:MoaA/NifB/PqqE/SkfB family radical SAM enzyme